MKKIFVFVLLLPVFFCSCTRTCEIEKNRVVTSCTVKEENGGLVYSFFVSLPSGGKEGESSPENSSVRVYSFKASDFGEAVDLFENGGQEKIDLTHMTLFAADFNYFKNHFVKDEMHIRECIRATPLIYTCVFSQTTDEFMACLTSEYKSDSDDFSKSVFKSPSSPFSCTISELSLCANNKYYTACIPSVSVKTNGDASLAGIDGGVVFSSSNSAYILTDDEFTNYSAWRKKHPKPCSSYELAITDDKLRIKCDSREMTDIARKYALMDVDILNAKYYARAVFKTYKDYYRFFDGYKFISTHISTEEK